MNEIVRKKEESKLQYFKRITDNRKELDLDYAEWAKILIGKDYSSDNARKAYYVAKPLLESLSSDTNNNLKEFNHSYDNYKQTKSYKETVEINKDGSYSSDRLIGIEDESVLKDENFLLKCHGYDPKLWEIVSARNSKWNAQLKGGKVTKMYASKINVRLREKDINIEELKEHFDKFQKEYKIIHKTKIIKNNLHNMLVLPFHDLHFGKKSFVFETGSEMDDKIIETRFFEVLEDIVSQVKHIKFEKVVFPIGSDFFNSDTIDNTTTKGTKQDNSLRWQEMFKKGIELLIKAIDYIVEELDCRVETVYIMGNHDSMSSFYANMYLYAWYKDDENVKVNISGTTRKYISYGKCLIGLTHGDKEGKRIYGLMQKEVPELWGKSIYREWITGHIHHETVIEKDGVKIRTTPTICGTDFWHYSSGYVGNLEQLQAFVYNKDKGLRNIVYGNFN